MVGLVDFSRADERSAILRRYGYAAANEWQRVLNHFALGEGFALLVLIVPDRDGAKLCRGELERFLADHGKLPACREAATPGELVQIFGSLLNQEAAGPDLGAIWVAAVVPHSAPDFADWEAAWRRSLEGLNQRRNPLRQHLHCPLVIVGAPWVVPLFREVAPDLWSVRSQVVRIEPDQDLERRSDQPRHLSTATDGHPIDAPDPALALREADRLRGVPQRENDLAKMLVRAGVGLLSRNQPQAAEKVLREAADLQAIAGDTAVSRGITTDMLGRAIRDQGRAGEAEEMFRRALALKDEGAG